MNEWEIMVYLFEELDILRKRLNDNQAILFLDYDGTLTPIVEQLSVYFHRMASS